MRRATVAMVLVAMVAWFALLGHRDLFDPDEGRYAEIPREMLASGDWVTPRLLGFKFLDKPPLQYWATAAAYAAFGASAMTARLWPAMLAFVGALFTGWLGRRLFGRDAGDIAFMVCVSGLLYFALGHLVTLDMGLSVFLTLALGTLAVAQTRRDDRPACRNWMLLAWSLLGAAVLSKGLVAIVLPAGALGIYMLWQRDWELMRSLHLGKGLLVLCAVSGPWMVEAALRNPEFVSYYFVREHFERFTTTVHHRSGPMYYFVAIFLAGAIPWVLLALGALVRPRFDWRGGEGRFEAERLFWVYVVFVIVFFSVSASKLPAYILPAWPFVALLAGRHAVGLRRWRADGWVLAAAVAVLLFLVVTARRFVSDTVPLEFVLACVPWALAAAAALAAGALALLLWRGAPKSAMAITATFSMLAFQMLFQGAQALSPLRSGREASEAIARLPLAEDAPIYLVGNYSPSLAFYLRTTPMVVDIRGDLSLGRSVEPDRALSSLGEFRRCWLTDSQAVAVIDNEREQSRLTGLPGELVYAGPRRRLIVKPAGTGAVGGDLEPGHVPDRQVTRVP